MDPVQVLDHQFVVAAYTITWVLQLGYLVYLAAKWRAEKRAAQRRAK